MENYLGLAGEAKWIEFIAAASQVIEERGPEHENCPANVKEGVGPPCDIARLRNALAAVKAG